MKTKKLSPLEAYGFPPRMMEESKFNDGSGHHECEKCGLCIECGDCAKYGCGKKEEK